jgi:hypothetical protein
MYLRYIESPMNLPTLPTRDLLAIRHSLALAQLELRCLRLSIALKRYNPNQPRVPAGQPGGGRWAGEEAGEGATSPDAPITPAASRDDDRAPLKIDLQEEEERGGHTLEKHVGKTDTELVERLEREHWDLWFVEGGTRRAGSFFSLGEANEYIGKTLEANQSAVDDIASGRVPKAFLTYRFGSVTGREAIVNPERRTISLRRTYGVGVYIFHDKLSRNGFRIQTAYPRNDDQ